MNDQDIHPEAVDETVQPGATGLVLPAQRLPDKLYIIPINNRPFFPAQVLPVMVNEHPWGRTLKRVENTEHKSLAVFYVDTPPDEHGEFDLDSLPEHGTLVRLHHVSEEGGKLQFVAQGLTRVRIRGWLSRRGPYLAEVEYPQAPADPRDEVKAYAMALINAIKELLPLNPLYSEELKNYLNRFSPNEPSPLTDFAAALTTASGHELQEVLDTVPMLKRMEKVLPLLRKEVEVGRLQKELSAEVNKQIGERQREFFLKEQLKLIQQELGISKDDKSADREEFLARLEGKTLTAAAQKRIDEELNKLSILEAGSPEYAVTRNYLDWATALPWGIQGQDKLDLGRARKVLDKHHAGMDDIKQRITEFLAVGAFKGEIAGSIVLLVGPPGVGKTSIGKSIAESLGRPFYRFSVGGMRDEAEIKGHRRTYIGAMPGKLVQALKEAEVMNPVIMLDEIDKMGTSYQGDPASALLETLDPEQNVEFLDHYLDLRLDLSKVLFVCTANTLDSIPGPLLDRMEVIRLSGYITEEKLAIAKRHLWPKQLEKAGVPKARLLRRWQGWIGHHQQHTIRILPEQQGLGRQPGGIVIRRNGGAALVVVDQTPGPAQIAPFEGQPGRAGANRAEVIDRMHRHHLTSGQGFLLDQKTGIHAAVAVGLAQVLPGELPVGARAGAAIGHRAAHVEQRPAGRRLLGILPLLTQVGQPLPPHRGIETGRLRWQGHRHHGDQPCCRAAKCQRFQNTSAAPSTLCSSACIASTSSPRAWAPRSISWRARLRLASRSSEPVSR